MIMQTEFCPNVKTGTVKSDILPVFFFPFTMLMVLFI